MIEGFEQLYFLIKELILNLKSTDQVNHMNMAAGFIGIIDTYILAIVMYTLAVSVYKLFFGNKVSIPWVDVENLNDLKSHLAKMSVLFLSTLLIQKITEWKNHMEVLCFSVSISMICMVLIFYIKHLDARKDCISKEGESILNKKI
jgi:uncharacterized membrane protein YqhA